MKNTTVYLEDDLYKAVEKAANKYHLSIDDLLSELIECNLPHFLKELYRDIKIGKKRANLVKVGKIKTRSMEQVFERLAGWIFTKSRKTTGKTR